MGDIVVSRDDGTVRIKGLLRDRRALLQSIGAVLQADAEEAFMLQRLGEHDWPVRYQFQRNPFINVAGAVSDWSRGASLKERRFKRKPALADTGTLANSLANARAVTVRESEVTVGTSVDYASQHQDGGVSVQRVTDQVRSGVAGFLRTDRGRQFRDRLGFLLNDDTTELRTRLHRRPFLGITPDGEREIIRLIEEHLEGAEE